MELAGPNGLLNQPTKNVLETALNAAVTEHLGYDRHDPASRGSGNSVNGMRTKTLLTEIGPVAIDVPREVNSSCESQIQRLLNGGVDEIVVSCGSRANFQRSVRIVDRRFCDASLTVQAPPAGDGTRKR